MKKHKIEVNGKFLAFIYNSTIKINWRLNNRLFPGSCSLFTYIIWPGLIVRVKVLFPCYLPVTTEREKRDINRPGSGGGGIRRTIKRKIKEEIEGNAGIYVYFVTDKYEYDFATHYGDSNIWSFNQYEGLPGPMMRQTVSSSKIVEYEELNDFGVLRTRYKAVRTSTFSEYNNHLGTSDSGSSTTEFSASSRSLKSFIKNVLPFYPSFSKGSGPVGYNRFVPPASEFWTIVEGSFNMSIRKSWIADIK